MDILNILRELGKWCNDVQFCTDQRVIAKRLEYVRQYRNRAKSYLSSTNATIRAKAQEAIKKADYLERELKNQKYLMEKQRKEEKYLAFRESIEEQHYADNEECVAECPNCKTEISFNVDEEDIICPSCGHFLEICDDEDEDYTIKWDFSGHCYNCGIDIAVKDDKDNKCPNCSYDLEIIVSFVCPMCTYRNFIDTDIIYQDSEINELVCENCEASFTVEDND